MNIKGKIALVTGAGRRLGREVVSHLSNAGCKVVTHYNRSAKEAEALQAETGCRIFHADFSTTTIADLKRRIDSEIGAVDILINNASSFQKSHWRDISEELWDSEFAVNLKTPFFLAQHLGAKMKEKREGKIINLADIAGYRAYLNYLPYSLAKTGVIALTQTLARALAPEVQVNGIAPGTVLFIDGLSDESKTKIVEKIPARRTAKISEFLATIDYLLSVDFLTGQTIVLDGGRTLTW
jgi:pteridine reductase